MTQAKSEGFQSLGRIPQFIGHAAVSAGLLAGGASLLNAGGAMAFITFPPDYPGQPPVGPDGVSTVGIAGPDAGEGTVNLAFSGVVGGKNTYQVDTDFDGPPRAVMFYRDLIVVFLHILFRRLYTPLMA